MPSLRQHLKQILAVAEASDSEQPQARIRLRVEKGTKARPKTLLPNQDTRWSRTLTGGGTECPVADKVSLMLCKGLERWFAGFIQQDETGSAFMEGGCTAETIAATNGLRDSSRCPYNPNKENWQFYDLTTELSVGKEETKTFIACRDIMTIFLTGLVNIDQQGGTWINTTSHLEPCQTLYQWYEEWGGQKAAKMIMQLLFPTTRRLKLAGNPLEMKEQKADEWWAKLLKGVPLIVDGLQCSRNDEEKETYITSCVKYRQDQGCSSNPPHSWDPNQAQQGLVLEEGQTLDQLSQKLEKVIQQQIVQDPVNHNQNLGTLELVKGIVGAGISGGFIPLVWYMWKRIFSRPTRVEPQGTRRLGYRNRIFE
ncbi:hypothetical protein C922_05100 [Plasmodium inui San Antonio 1]|uniref:Uncharacterized protein n=1 Tax=Plasmodium inui San Antonio 1 TaxID=1237626 RepID=W6ZZ00_9APIC|nr:hypothetical protein C922_05100 [Plasmodium inui San Antonio 1]EUD64538.1 hypothetical protein C922_05100 [Plasmodium inui San Antonio 1]